MGVSNVASPTTTAGKPKPSALFPAGNLVPFILITALFFLWAIPNNLNDVLIKQFMKSFEISRFQAGLVQSAFYMGYFLLAMPAAILMRKLWLQGRFYNRAAALRNRHVSFLAGGDGGAILVFPDGAVRHCQRAVVS